MTHVTHPIFVTHLTHDPSTHSLLWYSTTAMSHRWEKIPCDITGVRLTCDEALTFSQLDPPLGTTCGTSMSVLLIVGPKCTLATSYVAPGESRWIFRRNKETDASRMSVERFASQNVCCCPLETRSQRWEFADVDTPVPYGSSLWVM